MIRLFLSSLIFVSLSAIAHASTWDGEYEGSCHGDEKYECKLYLTDSAAGKVKAELTVKERSNYSATKCQFTGLFSLAKVGLHGTFGKNTGTVVISNARSGVALQITDKVASDCNVRLDGEYDIMGE